MAGTLAVLPAAFPAHADAAAPTVQQKAYDNGVLAYSREGDDVVHTVFPNQMGTNNEIVRTGVGLTQVTGIANEWSSDGVRLLVDQGASLVDLSPWTNQQYQTLTDPNGYVMERGSYSPDGTQFAYGTDNPAAGAQILRPGEAPRMVGKSNDGQSEGTAWANDDRLAAAIDGDGLMVTENASDDPQGSKRFVGDAVYPMGATISRDGQWVAYSDYGDSDYDVFIAKADGSQPAFKIQPNFPDPVNERSPAISPDGKKVAFVAEDTIDGGDMIWVYDIASKFTFSVAGTRTTGQGDIYSGLSWQPALKPDLTEVDPDGSTDLGGTLSPDPFEGSGTAPLTKTYKWQRCDDVEYPATNCVDIPGETNSTYTTTAADLGKRIRYERTWTNAAGSDTAFSLVSDTVVESDLVKPLAPTITGQPAAKSNETEPAFTWTGAEPGGTFQCSLDNAAFTSCTSGDTVTITTEGPHTFRVRQTDAANNHGDPAEYTWDVDVTPPSNPNVTKKPNAVTKSTTATIEFDGLDAGAKFQCREGKDPWADCVSPLELTGLTEGDKSYAIRQVDPAGNTSEEPALVDWTVDLTDPLAPTFGTNDPSVYVLSHQRTFFGEAGGTYECQLDDGAWEACTSPATLSGFTSGPHTFRVRQTDDAGNTGPAGEDQFVADVDGPGAPTIGATKPAKFAKSADATFGFTGAAQTVSFECRLDGGQWETCSSTKTYHHLDEGEHEFEVRGVNAADIRGTIASYEWTVDTKAPAKPIVMKQPDAETTKTDFSWLTVGGEEGTVRECSLDDATWTDCGPVLARNDLAVGPHELGIRLKDAAGNVSEFLLLKWTVVAPKPQAPAEPVVEPAPAPAPKPAPAPAPVETPTAPRATTPAPKAETATPAKPKLAALIGGSTTTGGTDKGTSSAAAIVVKKDGVGVGCSITGTVLTSCKVDLYVDRATGARAVAASRVLVGTGTVREAEGSKKMQVDVELNATGRELMRKSPNGLKVKVDITGVPVKGAALKATGVATLVRQRTSAVVGGFAVNSAKLTTTAKRQLTKLARQVKGTAVAVRVVGHTDGSSQDNGYLEELGKRRAAAVAKFLKAHGVKAKVTLISRGDRAPRATNATKAGRAKNRRVELRVDR